ncbi:MAG: hypothetical protein ABWZ40_01185 [Caulobacterales bacterium]
MSFKPTLLAAGLFAAALLSGAAQAQTGACAEDDLKCRITQLEARVDAMTGDLKTTQAKADTAAAAVSTKFTVRRSCAVSCVEEAQAECVKRGFADGSVKDMERQRSGPTLLTRVSCRN